MSEDEKGILIGVLDFFAGVILRIYVERNMPIDESLYELADKACQARQLFLEKHSQ